MKTTTRTTNITFAMTSMPRTSIPIPVQVFPIVDDFTHEQEKQKVSALAQSLFAGCEQQFLACLSDATRDVNNHIQEFLDNTHRASQSTGMRRQNYIGDALEELLACSPKKILAAFQKQALIAGWAYVSVFNKVIDTLAGCFPRCRAGIYGARLKYSDVLQISNEIMETLQSCSTLLDDLQRRFDLLESLQNNIQLDIQTPEAEVIIEAIKESFADNNRYGRKNSADNIDNTVRRLSETLLYPLTAVGDALSLPSLQIQGQMQRTRRILVFLETAKMFSDGWNVWSQARNEIVEPNIRIMFSLKRDYYRNEMLGLCDIVTGNGYKLDNLSEKITRISVSDTNGSNMERLS